MILINLLVIISPSCPSAEYFWAEDFCYCVPFSNLYRGIKFSNMLCGKMSHNKILYRGSCLKDFKNPQQKQLINNDFDKHIPAKTSDKSFLS